MKTIQTWHLKVMSAFVLSSSLLAMNAQAQTPADENVEIGFSLKLFASTSATDSLSIARGTEKIPFNVDVASKNGPMQCATTAAKLVTSTAATHFTFLIKDGEEVLCRSDEDRKVEVTYRIKKNIAENAYAQQINSTIAELKSGNVSSDFAKAVLKNVLAKNFRTVQLHAGRAEVILLDTKRANKTPMVGIFIASPISVGGVEIQPTGKTGTTNGKNLYPKLNRFALTCGFASEKDAQIANPMVPEAKSATTFWSGVSNGDAFGCIVNNSPDGFDAIDPYVEDPFYTVKYLILPVEDLRSGLEKMKFQITETIDADRAEKLQNIAKNLIETNKKRVQGEMDRRRTNALQAAGYKTSYTINMSKASAQLSLHGKPRYAQDSAGAIRTDTIFDVQTEQATYSFNWIDGSKGSFVEDSDWVGLKSPLISQDFNTQSYHFTMAYKICPEQQDAVRAYLLAFEKTPGTRQSKELMDKLAAQSKAVCGTAPAPAREMKYARYEGRCFVETPYTVGDSGVEMVRFKPSHIELVYTDSTGKAIGRSKLDQAKLGNDAKLFSGLDIVTTLPYKAARAAAYKVNCQGNDLLPIAQFDAEQIKAQASVSGFSTLVGNQIDVQQVKKEAKAQKADPSSGVIDLLRH